MRYFVRVSPLVAVVVAASPVAAQESNYPSKPISLIAGNPLVLVVGPSLGVKSVKDLVAMAQSQPGKLTFASSGVGSGTHYGGKLFAQTARIKVVHVPYRGTPAHIVEQLGREITRIAQMSDIREKIAAMGGRSWHSTPEEFDQLIRTEIETRGKVFKQAGVQPAS